jgi:hypothetical protein
MNFHYEFATGPSNVGNPDDGVENPDHLWENNCGASES